MATLEEARANSMRIYFGPGKKEPLDSEIFDFMKNKMRLSSDSLMSMYKEQRENCVYIKFKTEALLKTSLLNLPSTMEFHYSKYESTTVTFSAASSQFKYVRIFNLPPEINDQEISQVMAKYGVIQRMVRERYGPETGFPIWSSIRGVHMEIKQEIPATIHVRNFQARVFYDGLQNKCFVCGSREHMKVNCPKRASVNQRMDQNTDLSYSAVTARPERWLGRTSARKPEVTKEGEVQMTVLNNRFSTKPLNIGNNTNADEAVPMSAEHQIAGTSRNGKPTVPAARADEFSKSSRDMEEVTSELNNKDNTMVTPLMDDAVDQAPAAETKNDEGEQGFQLVQYRKNKPMSEMVVQGKTFISPANISLSQSTRSRTRSRQNESDDKRSRSRSRHSLDKGTQRSDEKGDEEDEVEGRGDNGKQ